MNLTPPGIGNQVALIFKDSLSKMAKTEFTGQFETCGSSRTHTQISLD